MGQTPRVAAVGVGYSTTGRRTGLNSRELAIQAAKAAMADAGMTPKDIDGVAVLWAVSGPAPPGVESVQALDIAQMMGFAPVGWYSDGAGRPISAPPCRPSPPSVQGFAIPA